MDTLRNFLPFWDQLSEEQQQGLINHSFVYEYPQGAQVHSGSTDCIGILLLTQGILRTYMLSEDGREITLFRMKKGDVCVLSASCILDDVTFDIHIDAETPARAIQINTTYFQQLARENIHAECFLYRCTLERFSQVMWVMEQVLFMSMDKRLAIFLLDQGPVVHMTHDQIAKHVGSAREVITRMLRYFSSEDWVSLSRGTVKVTNRSALLRLV